MSGHYDAIIVISFGAPEAPGDVIPFLDNVVRGKNVPRERLLEVAERYQQFGGASPMNAQNRALIASLVEELNTLGPELPVYWGNRNWHPLLAETIKQMADDGVQRALAFVTSAFSSYSGCRQYLENIEHARQEVGPTAPQIDKLRIFYNHPGFILSVVDRIKTALGEIPESRRQDAALIFTAHSLPMKMAENCDYVQQLNEACRLVCTELRLDEWHLAYQSRSGPPSQPWLEPDIGDFLHQLAPPDKQPVEPTRDIVVVPIGFLSDHMEVIYDLDTEARAICDSLGLNMVLAATVGNHPRFVEMIRELIVERTTTGTERKALGNHGPQPDECPADCCPSG